MNIVEVVQRRVSDGYFWLERVVTKSTRDVRKRKKKMIYKISRVMGWLGRPQSKPSESSMRKKKK
jgi:hypothetical protein